MKCLTEGSERSIGCSEINISCDVKTHTCIYMICTLHVTCINVQPSWYASKGLLCTALEVVSTLQEVLTSNVAINVLCLVKSVQRMSSSMREMISRLSCADRWSRRPASLSTALAAKQWCCSKILVLYKNTDGDTSDGTWHTHVHVHVSRRTSLCSAWIQDSPHEWRPNN